MFQKIAHILFLLSFPIVFAQIAHYNYFPSLQPQHILDTKLDDISFAFSMRVLESDYDGPLIRLRRDSDDTEMDFGWGDNDIVDVAAIDTWRASANVFVVTWYDQSGLGRNAEQATTDHQPEFITTNPDHPYFVGDGVNDHLDVNTSIQTLTNAGVDGTVFTVVYTTGIRQFSFGTVKPGSGADRWATHLNWNDNQLYFDSGVCCDYTVRNISNTNNEWQQLSFIREPVVQSIRKNGVLQRSGNYSNGPCTATNGFGILYPNGFNGLFATNRYTEMIMYSIGVDNTNTSEIEENQLNFWQL